MRRVILCADDLGANPSRSHGILECVRFGTVSSVSLFCTMSDSQRAAELARRAEVCTGLHFNLTEGFPSSKQNDIASLVSFDGLFFTKEQLLRAFKDGQIEKRHVERELRAQLEWFSEHRGESPSHANGHEQIHLEPMVAEVLAELLPQYGVRFVRMPVEPAERLRFEVPAERIAAAREMASKAEAVRSLYEMHGLSFTDHFRGFLMHGMASKKNLRHILGNLPEGTTEIILHPGQRPPMGMPFDLDPQRETELRMLLDEELPFYLKEQRIELTSFRNL